MRSPAPIPRSCGAPPANPTSHPPQQEARIEASGSADLTRLCLEEALAALGTALTALDRSSVVPRQALGRAQSILIWLTQSVAPGHPLHASLKQFYGGLASQIGANLLQADRAVIETIMIDIKDLLEAAR